MFAAVKTSLNAASAPLVELLVLDDAGVWHEHTVFTVADQPTRAQVILDPVRRQLHVVASDHDHKPLLDPACNPTADPTSTACSNSVVPRLIQAL